MSHTLRTGIVGIGAMGFAIARNLQGRGRSLVVRDVDREAVDAAQRLGVQVAGSSRELAGLVDLVVVVVVDAAQVEAVLFGAGGVVEAVVDDGAAPPTVLICSTIAAHDTERFAERLALHQIDVLDGPVSGGPARAADGSLSMMLAGDAALRGRFEPVLREIAAHRFVIGSKVGDAARAKLVNNLLAGVNLVAAAEALTLGARLGLDRATLFDVIDASSGASWIGRDRMARALRGDYAPRARMAILTKDVRLAVRMAAAAGVDTPLGKAALRRFEAAVAEGFGDADDAAVVKSIWPEF